MSLLRNVWTDLVEKRLWPVAVALVVALVAVPVVLARPGSGGDAPAPAAAAPAAKVAGGDVVSLDTAPPTRAPTGRPHDPFAAGAKAKTGAGGTSTPSGSGGASSSGSGAGSGGATTVVSGPSNHGTSSSGTAAGGSTASGSTGSTPATPVTPVTPSAPDGPTVIGAPTPAVPAEPGHASAGYRVDVSFGPATGTDDRTDIARLTVLKAGDSPVLLYLGVRADKKTAVFQIAGDGVVPSGDGRCLPSPTACEAIELKADETEFLDVPTATGVVQYELDVTKVAAKHTKTTAAAAKARRRESKAGRAVLRDVIAAGHLYVGNYVYSKSRGVLLRRQAHPSTAP